MIIFGVGRFAEYVQYVFNEDSSYQVVGFCIEKSYSTATEYGGLPVYPFEDLENIFPSDSVGLFVAVGQNLLRKRIFEEALRKGFPLASYISGKAITWPNLKIGDNCFIGEGSVIQPFVHIGDNSIHFGSRIGHHSKIASHTLLSGTTIGGNVEVGLESYLGMNSTVKQNVSIGNRNIIGMNVSIEKDTDPNSVYSHRGSFKRDLQYEHVTSRFLL